MKTLLVKICILFASVIIMLMAAIVIVLIHSAKFIRKLISHNRFCDS